MVKKETENDWDLFMGYIESLGGLGGKCTITISLQVPPVAHVPCKILLAWRHKVKPRLPYMEQLKVNTNARTYQVNPFDAYYAPIEVR